MMKRILPALVLTLASALPISALAQGVTVQDIDKIIAVVDEDVILNSELDRAVTSVLAQFESRGQSAALPPRDVIERQVLERLILQRVQVARAEGTGIRVSDIEVDDALNRLAAQNNASIPQLRSAIERDGASFEEFRNGLRDELSVQRLRQRFVQSRVQVSDTEVDILLASNQLRTGEIRVSHILIGIPENANASAVQASAGKAAKVIEELNGGLDFASAAIKYSDGQQALEGGDLGWRRMEQIPSAFAEIVGRLRKGEVSEPVRGPSGFHILKLVDEREAEKTVVKEFHTRHVVVKVSELVTEDQALDRIQKIRDLLLKGAKFEETARKFSEDDATSNLGGDMGWSPEGAFGPRVTQVIDGLKDGELSEPFRSDLGWHVLLREASREVDRSVEARREQARETLVNRKAEEEYDAFLRQLKGEAYIENRLTAAG
ncbi:peptidylprolyl isomerase [Ahniella affigens]|nr:peptidylprolyl isomerase [Ahniella affigens]